jgi:hypothetical protein
MRQGFNPGGLWLARMNQPAIQGLVGSMCSATMLEMVVRNQASFHH